MPPAPWWIDRVRGLLEPLQLRGSTLGLLWNLAERLQFVRENVEPGHLRADFEALPSSEAVWTAFVDREGEVLEALARTGAALAEQVRGGELGPVRFRKSWEGLGFDRNVEGAGTPADDYLDAMFHVSRLTLGDARPRFGLLNMATRAQRAADFLAVTQPGPDDLVVDLGSGSGKVALTVAASTFTQVQGVELGASYVAAARGTATSLGLRNVEFLLADVREADLSRGTIFYLYYPFCGEVAASVAATLGLIARSRDITIYSSGPLNGYGEHFLDQVENGSLRLCERRGEFAEVMVLRSSAGT